MNSTQSTGDKLIAREIAVNGATPASAQPLEKVRIEPVQGWAPLRLDELWRYRELLYFFTWRDVKVRYKQTILGASWAIIQPFFTMIVFSLFFGRLAGIPSDGIPYPIFSYAALVPWAFFSNGLTMASQSLVNSANLIKKVYFPRMVVPAASVVSGLVDFVLAFVVLLLMMLFFGISPFNRPIDLPFWLPPGVELTSYLYGITYNVVFVPYFLLIALITSLGMGLWLSAMNVQFRDVRYIVPFLVQIWLFATPIAYPSSLLSEPWRTLYGLNPMAGVVEGFRWALLATDTAPGPIVMVSSVVAVLFLVSGAYYFRRMEKSFADVV